MQASSNMTQIQIQL